LEITMEKPAPPLPKTSEYVNRWKAAKKKFEEMTGKEKPAPTTEFKLFSGKIDLGKRRHGTGIDSALKDIEESLPEANKSQKTLDKYEKALATLQDKSTAYIRFLEEAIKVAPPGVDKKVWKAGILTLKQELRHIVLAFNAYRDKIKVDMGKVNKASFEFTAKKLDTNLEATIGRAREFVKEVRSKPTADTFNTNIVKATRDITQNLMNIEKLKISIGYEPTKERGKVPPKVEDALEAWGNARRSMPPTATQEDVLKEVGKLEKVLDALVVWMK
jgi:hypothetical protein